MSKLLPLINKDSFVMPDFLYLAWKCFDFDRDSFPQKRLSRKVGQIFSKKEGLHLEYFLNSEDFNFAKDNGFEGFPGCDLEKKSHKSIESLCFSRVISKKRGDFDFFLESWRVDSDLKKDIDSFYMLGLTSGRLQGNAFRFFPFWSKPFKKLSLITLIEGFQYQENFKQKDLKLDIPLDLKIDKNNQFDKNVYQFFYKDKKIGYLSRILKNQIHDWFQTGYKISTQIARFNGEKIPKVYAHILAEKQ